MATEADRTTSVRRITNPDDHSAYVDLKVIDAIAFIDPQDRGQETRYTLNNGADDLREVHVKSLTGLDGSSKLDVERIDVISVKDDSDRGQETQFSFDNAAEPPTHLATHDVQIYSLDGGAWIKVRRTDKFAVVDPSDRGQETVHELTWIDDDTGNPPEPLDPPVTTWDGTDINPPWRLDPFQNIIDVSWGGGCMLVLYNGNSVAAIPMSAISDPSPAVTYRSVLAKSNWSTVGIAKGGVDNSQVLSQVKFSDTLYPILASFHVTKTWNAVTNKFDYSIKEDAKYTCWSTKSFTDTGATSTLDVGYGPIIENVYKGSLSAIQTFDTVFYGNPPIINGSVTKVYFLGDVFTGTDNVFALTTSALTAPTDERPTFMSATGQAYIGLLSGLTSSGQNFYSSVENYSHLSSAQSTSLPRTPYTISTSGFFDPSQGGWPSTGGTNTTTQNREWEWAYTGGPDAALAFTESQWTQVETRWWTGSSLTDKNSTIVASLSGGDCSISVPRLRFSQSHGVDALAVDATTATIVYTYDQDDAYWRQITFSGGSYITTDSTDDTSTLSSASLSYLGVTATSSFHYVTHSDSGSQTGSFGYDDTYVLFRQFPYWSDDKFFAETVNTTFEDDSGSGMIDFGDNIDHGAVFKVITPWTTITGKRWFRGWLHCSNGQHVIQGVLLCNDDYSAITQKLLYLDGVDYSTKLAAAIGVDMAHIDAVLFDISLGSIKQLV